MAPSLEGDVALTDRILWVNPLAKTCPYCWYGEPCSLDQRKGTDGTLHLKDHLMRAHRANCSAYAAGSGLKGPDQAAWELVKRARVRFAPPYAPPAPVLAEAREPMLVEVPRPK